MTYIKPFPDGLPIDTLLQVISNMTTSGIDYEVSAANEVLIATKSFRRKEASNLLVPGIYYELISDKGVSLDWRLVLKTGGDQISFYCGAYRALIIDYKNSSIKAASGSWIEETLEWMANEILGDPGCFD